MKRQKLPNLPKPPAPNTKVTIVRRGVWGFSDDGSSGRETLVLRATVVRMPRRGEIAVRVISKGSTYRFVVRRNKEGRTWARGWDTPEADALRTVVALSAVDPQA